MVTPLVGLILVPAVPAPGTDVARDIRLKAALVALDEGDRLVATELIAHTCDDTLQPLDLRVCEALIAKAEGRMTDVARIVDAMSPAPDPEAFSSPEFYRVFLRLAAERHLEVVRTRSAKKLESVLERHYRARGGLEALLGLDDVLTRGRMLTGGREYDFVMIRKRPACYRLDVLTPDGVRIQATDGAVAWQVDPSVQDGRVLELGATAAARLNRQAIFDDVLIRYTVTGERLLVRDPAPVDGRDAYRIDVDLPTGEREAVFLDAATFLEVRRQIWTDPESPPVVATFEHQMVDGLSLPSRQTLRTPSVVIDYVFDHYEIGNPIDRAMFDPVLGSRVPLVSSPAPAAAHDPP